MPADTDQVRRASVVRALHLDGRPTQWHVAAEVAVEIDVNSAPVTVTMATPADLEDLALGLAYTEGVVLDPGAVTGLDVRDGLDGIVVDLQVPEEAVNAQARRARLLEGRSGCGLCGVDTLASAMRRPPIHPRHDNLEGITDVALARAFEALRAQQPLNQLTRSVHGAAWCTESGDIVCLREDVGRHNALDKLAGWLMRSDAVQARGFVILSSRLSFELVCKAAAMGACLLGAVSAPTALALELAELAELPLVCLGPGGVLARF